MTHTDTLSPYKRDLTTTFQESGKPVFKLIVVNTQNPKDAREVNTTSDPLQANAWLLDN